MVTRGAFAQGLSEVVGYSLIDKLTGMAPL